MTTNYPGLILGLCLNTLKSFFASIVQVVWGVSSFLFLIVLLKYLEQDVSAISPTLLSGIVFIQDNLLVFFTAIFLWEFLVNFKGIEFLAEKR